VVTSLAKEQPPHKPTLDRGPEAKIAGGVPDAPMGQYTHAGDRP
jgi:hypothetical protein